jgi:mycothiol synthase
MKLRPPRDEDFDAMLEVLNAPVRAAYGEDSYSANELRNWLTSPKVDPQRDIRLAEEDGLVIGYVDVDPQGSAPVRWWSDVRVHPDVDAGGVVPALVAWAEERARSGILRVWTASVLEDVRAAYETLSFKPTRHSFRMAIELGGEPEQPAWPQGISVRPFRTGNEHAVYEAVKETWLDTWEPMEDPYEEWAHWSYDREDFDSSLWFLASAGEEIAGFALCQPSETRADTGWVNVLGVRRPWRRRGLGEALLRHAFVEFGRRGFPRVGLGVDAQSPTGATRLYERAGMHVERQTDFYEKDLEPDLGTTEGQAL